MWQFTEFVIGLPGTTSLYVDLVLDKNVVI